MSILIVISRINSFFYNIARFQDFSSAVFPRFQDFFMGENTRFQDFLSA